MIIKTMMVLINVAKLTSTFFIPIFPTIVDRDVNIPVNTAYINHL